MRSLAAALAVGAALVTAAPVAIGDTDETADRTVLLVTTAEQGGALATVEGALASRRVAPRVHVVEVDPAGAAAVTARLRGAPGVVAVESSGVLAPLAVPNDPGHVDQWAHDLTGIAEAWDVSTGTAAVGVALLDGGVNGEHPDLATNLSQQVDATGARVATRTLGSNNDSCGLGHGTEVAGVIGADGNNGRDVAGAAWTVSLIDVAVVGPQTSCRMTDASLVTGLGWAAEQSTVDVINVSFGRQAAACPTALQAAIDDAVDAGKVVVAAAGNARHHATTVATIPASCAGVIAVGAVGSAGTAASYSTTGAWVDLVAPGGEPDDGILTLSDDLGTTTVSGTSFAAGYVSGIVALLLSADPGATPDEVERALLGTAADVTPTGRDDATGWGLVDPASALAALTDGPLPEATDATSLPVGDLGPARLAATTSDVIAQAVVVSRSLFRPDDARHAVLARADDYADALAGSTLASGWGPVLLASRSGPLPASVKVELDRALPEGGTVYLLGGTSALPATAEDEVAALGLRAERLAGTTREATAAVVADEVAARRGELGAPAVTIAIVATARNWPDAAIASSLAAVVGAPVLVTAPGSLHPAAADALSSLEPTTLYIVGGTAAVSGATADAASRAAGTSPSRTIRLAGVDRTGTAVQVAAETESVLRTQSGAGPSVVVGVNIRRADGFGFILSAAPVVATLGGVFVPIEGDAGSTIDDGAAGYACGILGRPVVVGAVDVVSAAAADRLMALVAGTDPACGG